MFPRLQFPLCLLVCLVGITPARAAFSLSYEINENGFTPSQLTALNTSLDLAKTRWEKAITGYQPGISVSGFPIEVRSGSAFAAASSTGSVSEGGFVVSTRGRLFVNPTVIDAYASWNGVGPNNPNPAYIGLNYLDDILGHEIGHALGIGTLWSSNKNKLNMPLVISGTGQYTGEYGVRAYQKEFDPLATFVPVELAGSSGTQNSHWDQIMRSSTQEGNPSDPWNEIPLTDITDAQGRDFALELMTGALDPDYGEPFLSMTTIQSLRDMGYTVVPEPSGMVLLVSALMILFNSRRREPVVWIR